MENKMTPKEALEELKFQVGNITYFTKDLQATTHKVRDSGLFETIEKELKALEIIRNKEVDINNFLYFVNGLDDEDALGTYNGDVYRTDRQLTKQEYELLKEVLK